MSNTEALYCENGHHWEREIKRGKKPRWCPEHQPAPVSSNPLTPSPQRELVCAFDGHLWTWTPKRGRSPKYCPEHKTIANKPQGRSAYCANGAHNWVYLGRGRVPTSCPEHRAERVRQHLSEEEKIRRRREGKERAREEREQAQIEMLKSAIVRQRERIGAADEHYRAKYEAYQKLSVKRREGSKQEDEWLTASERCLAESKALYAKEKRYHELVS
jgi:hypothetical protein